jgi:hypothetical protein
MDFSRKTEMVEQSRVNPQERFDLLHSSRVFFSTRLECVFSHLLHSFGVCFFSDLLIVWRGRNVFSHPFYKNCAARNKFVEVLSNQYGTSIGGFEESFLEDRGRSRFCVVPGGVSPWTNHLYESILGG